MVRRKVLVTAIANQNAIIFKPYFTLRTVRVLYSGTTNTFSRDASSLNLPQSHEGYSYLESIVSSRCWLIKNHGVFR